MTTIPTDTRSKIVLVVDDSPEILSLITAMLSGAGYTVVGASSGENCLALVHRCPPRMILLDVQMPGIDGFETCRRLREYPELKTTPIAFLTALKTRGDVKEGLTAGGNDFIVKPVSRDALLQRVQHWTSHRVAPVKSAA